MGAAWQLQCVARLAGGALTLAPRAAPFSVLHVPMQTQLQCHLPLHCPFCLALVAVVGEKGRGWLFTLALVAVVLE